jgi:hypothetical protein
MEYRADITGSSWARRQVSYFDTITDARAWAESYGTTADRCYIYSGSRLIALHCRDTRGNGTNWYRARTNV